MFIENVIYNNPKNCCHQLITHMLGAELRNAIQNWRKANSLPIDFVIPTLNVYFTETILKTVLIEGICDHSREHIANICLIDKIVFKNPTNTFSDVFVSDHDIFFWSDLGGTLGYSDLLRTNETNIQKAVNMTIKEKLFNTYY